MEYPYTTSTSILAPIVPLTDRVIQLFIEAKLLRSSAYYSTRKAVELLHVYP